MERWYCAEVRREELAIRLIREQRFQTLAPKYVDRVVRHGRPYVKKCPVFRGYVLVRFDENRDRWQSINNTRGVRGLILAGDDGYKRPVPVDDEAVYELQARCRGGEFIDDMPGAMTRLWHIGQKVNVIEGPWIGSIAEVKRVWDDQDRIDVLISLFGRRWTMPVQDKMIEAMA